MLYIANEPNEIGNYGNPQDTPFPDAISLPDELLEEYISAMGFVNLTIEKDVITAVEPNADAFAAYEAALPAESAVELTPSERRENAYNENAVIEWDGETITVTAAAQLWQYYAAEGNAKAEELTALISAAKAEIREKYPDGE